MINKGLNDFIKANYRGLIQNSAILMASSFILLASELALPLLITFLVNYYLSEKMTKEEKAIQLVVMYNITTQINSSLKEWAHLCAQELGDKLSHLIYLEGLDKLNRSPLSTRTALKDADHTNNFLATCVSIDLVVTNFASMLVPLYISQRTLFDADSDNNKIAYLNLVIILTKLFLVSQTSSQIDQYQDQSQNAMSDLLSFNNDMLRGHKLILSENTFKQELNKCIAYFNQRYATATQQNRYVFLINTGIDILSVIPLIYILYDLSTAKQIAISDYLLLLNGLTAANSASKNLNVFYLNSKILLNSIQRLMPIFTRELEDTITNAIHFESIVSIEFINVFYKNQDDKLILENVSFKLNLGELIAFSGKSGAGKSTIFNLLQKFIYPTSGTILINNIPLSDFSPSQIREKITCITSDTYVFNRPLIDIIRYGLPDSVTNEDINRVIKWIGLGEKISKLPDGLNTVIQSNGQGELSGGERQLIHLVRAFLKNKQNLLILDEAVSSIDADKLTNIINPYLRDSQVKQNRIILIISHDSKNLNQVDRVLHVENKQVRERAKVVSLNTPVIRPFFNQQPVVSSLEEPKVVRRHSI